MSIASTVTAQQALETAAGTFGHPAHATLALGLVNIAGTQSPVGLPANASITDAPTITQVVDPLTKCAFNKVTLAGSRTLVISGAVAGSYGSLIVTQDGSGSRALTLPSGKLSPSNLLSTAAGSVDWVEWTYDGTNYFFKSTKALT